MLAAVPRAEALARGPRGSGLEVAHRVHRGPVDADFEVQVVAEAVTGAAHRADHLALLHVLAGADSDRRLVRVTRRRAAAVLDARVLAVAAHRARHRDRTAGGRPDRRAG